MGRALVEALAAEGCRVVVHYGRSAGPAEELRALLESSGAEVELVSADLRVPESPARVVAAAVDRFGRLDVLINSAAVFPEDDSFDSLTASGFDGIVDLNLRAPLLLVRELARHLPPDGRGAVLQVLDARTRRTGTDHFVYRLAKGALWSATENLALAMAPRVRVNAVALGAILPPPGAGPERLERIVSERVPLGFSGGTRSVTASALHLLENDFLTGVIIPVDGGEFL